MEQAPNVPVIAIIGAGASLASGDFAPLAAPPLTNTLFNNPRADQLLPAYPMAQKAARFIAREMQRDPGTTFEQALRALRLADNEYMSHIALCVPLYLQELLLSVSAELSPHTERYDSLTLTLSTLSKVFYVSLNYDTLLDNQLDPFHGLHGFDDYISPDNRWALIKPHGSVNWSFLTDGEFNPRVPRNDLAIDERQMVHERPDAFSIDRLRRDRDGRIVHYPALAVPEGPKDRLVMPQSHVDYFRNGLADATQIDVLVLGYSALDTEVLQLIKDSGTPIRRMTIVNRSGREALLVYDVISRFGITAIWPDVYDGSFANWVDGDGLRSWVGEFGGPYNTISDPAALRETMDDPPSISMVTRGGTMHVPSWEDLTAQAGSNDW